MLMDIIGANDTFQFEPTLKYIADMVGRRGRLGKTGAKILQWVYKFKQIGDIIIQFDPKHSALPWAGFRFLLQVELIHHWN